MTRYIFLALLLLGISDSSAGPTTYVVEFEVFEGEFLVSSPSVSIGPGQIGQIHVGNDDDSILTLKFVLVVRENGLILLDSDATYRGETHSPDLLVEIEREACLIIAEYAFTISVRELVPSDA